VATKFQPVSRLTELSFSHYQEAASLPADQARDVLGKAAPESIFRRPSCGARSRRSRPRTIPNPAPSRGLRSKANPSQRSQQSAELTVAYEMVIEFAEALEKERALTKRERRLFTLASEFVGEAHAGHRACPDDFDVIFVEQGRLECEAWYRASRLTVNRWLLERGKSRLIKLRADFLRHQRDAGRPVVHDPDVDLPPIDEALHAIAKQAAHFLRVSRYGGWTDHRQ
jgi:hypothetical protein